MDDKVIMPTNIINDIDSLTFPELDDEELDLCNKYVDTTSNLTESDQLFDSFYFNLLTLRNLYILYLDGRISKTKNCVDFYSDYVAINSLVSNVISSAKTFTEYLRQHAIKNCSNEKEFNDYVSSIYDASFNYRFLNNLRDFVQHRSLPLSKENNIYSFDLIQILNTEHFTLKNNIKNLITDFLSKCKEPDKKFPRINLVYTLAEYTVDIIDIYRKYLSCIKNDISQLYTQILNWVEDKPELINHGGNHFDGFVFFIKSNTLHCFQVENNLNDLVNKNAKKCDSLYIEENRKLEEINSFKRSVAKLL